MAARWKAIKLAFANSTRWRIASHLDVTPDAFFGSERHEAAPSYLWVQRLDGGSATAGMLAAGIQSDAGRGYAAGPNFVRLIVMQRQHDFDVLLSRLVVLTRD